MDCSPGGFGDRMSTLRHPSFHGGGMGDGGAMVKVVNVPLPEDLFGEMSCRDCSLSR
jgi:hypothetical protein